MTKSANIVCMSPHLHPSHDSKLDLSDAEITAMRALTISLGCESGIPDFDRLILPNNERNKFQLWTAEGRLAAYAVIDGHICLWFEIDPKIDVESTAAMIITWGINSVRDESGFTLNSCASSTNLRRIQLLETNGFIRQSGDTLNYTRSLTGLIDPPTMPPGFICRSVKGESEVKGLVELQRATFKTEYMTINTRLAQMRATGYCPDLDLVVTAPDGQLAAFCFCKLGHAGLIKTGFAEPIGTHPNYRDLGLAQALLITAMNKLLEKGCQSIRLSTNVENIPMRHLAESLGFSLDDNLIWYSISSLE
jgi:ribosomal protein S18 acetylase RimI-like enzyme